MPRFLLHMVHQHLDFRLAELDSRLEEAGISPAGAYDRAAARALQRERTESPYLLLELPSAEAAAAVCARMVLAMKIIELWGDGEDYPSAADAVAAAPAALTARHFAPDASWSVQVDAFGRSLSMAQQEEIRQRFRGALPFEGPVRCRGADSTFWILEENTLLKPSFGFVGYAEHRAAPPAGGDGAGGEGGGAEPSADTARAAAPAPAPRPDALAITGPPRRVYFGREVGRSSARGLVDRCDLRRRRCVFRVVP